jgi:hypothetical protein
MSKEYNGWSNYETWVVNLWLENDQSTYNFMLELLAHAREDYSDKSKVVYSYADMIKEYIEENTPEVTGMYADLLNSAISEVNFREIARSWYEDNPIEDDDDDDDDDEDEDETNRDEYESLYHKKTYPNDESTEDEND